MTGEASRAGRLLGATAVLALAAVGVALVSQHVFDMQPCPWCVLQRAIFFAIAIACAVGLVWRSARGRSAAAALVLMLALAGAGAALWQHFQAAASQSCNLTFADKIVSSTLHLDSLWPDVFAARASCADAAVKLFGVSYDFWALGMFGVLALLAIQSLRTGSGQRIRP